MTSDYKKYSLDKLQEWVHDAMNSDASPHEIYSAIREAVREEYYYHKDRISHASGLLELLSGHRPVKNDDIKQWDAWEETYYPEEYKGSTVSSVQVAKDPSPNQEDINDEYNLREAEYYNKKSKLDSESEKQTWIVPVADDFSITFPDDLLEKLDWKEGDTLEWIDQGDGSFHLKKIIPETPPAVAELYEMIDGQWVSKPIEMDEC